MREQDAMYRKRKAAGRTTCWFVLIWGLLGAGPHLAEAQRKKEAPPAAPEVVKQGRILVVRGLRGGEPQLTDTKDKRWMIVGALQGEVLQLDGHTLKVWGNPGKERAGSPTLEISRYEILDSGGERPLVGMLRDGDREGLLLEQKGGSVRIRARAAFEKKLKKYIGCKIWLAGKLEADTVKPYKFGWINCKPPKVIKHKKESTK